jgi:hypothetical protein
MTMCKVGDTVKFPSGTMAKVTRLDESFVAFDLLDAAGRKTGEHTEGVWFATWVKVVESPTVAA